MYDQQVLQKLDEVNRNLIKLAVIISVQGKDSDFQVRVLRRAGFTLSEIERVTGVPVSTAHRHLKTGSRKSK